MAPHLLAVSAPDAAGVATLTLNRPEKRNALSIALRDEISDALDRLAEDQALKVLVITGAGPAFCAGFDLREFENPDADHQRRLWGSSDRYHRAVLEFPLPTVAAVNGPALAGGCDLAVLCDVRVAADTASFAHPEHTFGDVVYGPLHDLIGGAAARELCLTGRRIDATEALRLGLVSRVVARDELDEVAAEVAHSIAEGPRDVLVRMKAKFLRYAGIVAESGTLDL
jgi:enoyl-CoA hydratase